ncbi:MAG TPA: SBBP repeat-containing protein, partial [Bacteroidia bacterium]|nr:SBBP repeat-containing protein [Bacteroidia bacterium]
FGGSNYEWGTGLAADASGNLFLGGFTGSGDLPTLNPGGGAYFQGALAGGGDFDLFLCKFSSAGALIWSTYYGGSLDDRARSVDVDAAGNFWVTGYTTSSDFPTLNPGGGAYYQGVFGGGVNNGDAFILKFDNNGKQILGTYYGGAGDEEGYSIKAAKSGNILITGYTNSANFPTLNPGGGAYFQAAIGGGNDAFISKFSNTGKQLWSTYYGGSGDESSGDDTHTNGSITADGRENIYVTGATTSSNLPTKNPGGTTFFQGANGGTGDAFILKFRPSGVPVWATYYGGASSEEGNSIITDTSGTIYVTGQSLSSSIPMLNPGGGVYYQSTNGGTMDIFITEFDSTGILSWGTFFGGNSDDWSTQATIAPTQCLVMTGEWVSSSGISTVNPGGGAYYQSSMTGTHDGYIMKFCALCSTPNVKVNPASASECIGDSTLLTASGASAYTWKPATGLSCTNCANPTAKPATTTTYTVIGTNAGICKDSTTITVTIDPGPVITLSPDIAIILGNSTTLTATGGGTYSWVPPFGLSCTNCPSPSATPTVTTAYCVTVTDTNGCTNTQCVTVTVDTIVVPCGNLFIPDAFSPNGDGSNDILYVKGTCLQNFDFVIFDRWGNKIFESEDQSKGWDGTYKGEPMTTGTYVY